MQPNLDKKDKEKITQRILAKYADDFLPVYNRILKFF